MGDPVIAALIGLLGSAIGSIIGIITSAKLTEYRLKQLEAKVEKHNNLIERVFRLEGRTDVQEQEISDAKRRLDDLERRHGN